jgi:hypothetical protein
MRPDPPAGELPFEPVIQSGAGTAFECGLCGLRFTHGGKVCSSCVLSNGCDLVKCPGCGYQFPRESRMVSLMQRLLRAWGTPRGRA